MKSSVTLPENLHLLCYTFDKCNKYEDVFDALHGETMFGIPLSYILMGMVFMVVAIIKLYLQQQESKLIQEKDAIIEERDAIIEEKNAIIEERDELIRENAMIRENAVFSQVGDMNTNTIDAKNTEISKMKMDAMLTDMEHRHQIIMLNTEIAGLHKEIAGLHDRINDLTPYRDIVKTVSGSVREFVYQTLQSQDDFKEFTYNRICGNYIPPNGGHMSNRSITNESVCHKPEEIKIEEIKMDGDKDKDKEENKEKENKEKENIVKEVKKRQPTLKRKVPTVAKSDK